MTRGVNTPQLALLAAVILMGGCAGGELSHSIPDHGVSDLIRERLVVSEDCRGFVTATSFKPFIPLGFNYDRDYRMRLLEDYWESEWDTIEEDFAEMKALGANVVRIHLQFAKFMRGPEELNAASLKRLGRLLTLAERTGLYLDLTGLGCYRKTDVPAWYDALDEGSRWRAQARFWEGIAECCRRSPAVFCYNLMNEPAVPGAKRKAGDWLLGEFGGFCYLQAITLDPAGRPRDDIAREWTETLTRAIRRQDPGRLVTVGLLPNSLPGDPYSSGFVPSRIAPIVDYVSVHLYPKTGKLDEELKRLQAFNAGKPVVIEELFPLECTATELGEFMNRSRGEASGWIGFYWGQTPEELRRTNTIPASLTLKWLELFQTLARRDLKP